MYILESSLPHWHHLLKLYVYVFSLDWELASHTGWGVLPSLIDLHSFLCVWCVLHQTPLFWPRHLVMRASGTYRVLLNTHLWSQMSCERANQKSIRITAQHVNSTDDIGVYLVTVSLSGSNTYILGITIKFELWPLNVVVTKHCRSEWNLSIKILFYT